MLEVGTDITVKISVVYHFASGTPEQARAEAEEQIRQILAQVLPARDFDGSPLYTVKVERVNTIVQEVSNAPARPSDQS